MENPVSASNAPSNKDYLGDSVYADFDGWYITLTTENGVEASNTIALEPQVFNALLRYAERFGWKKV
jgi:hypothetical protein